MKRLILPLIALVLAAGIARSAPQVNTWEVIPQIVWSDTLGQAAGDTLFTDSVTVFGSRAVLLFVRSTATNGVGDSLNVPILQSKLPGGAWTYVGGAASVPPATFVVTAPLAATTVITNQRFAWGIYNEFSGAGTPVPFTNEKFRWRIKNNGTQRKYLGAGLTQLQPSGTFTLTVLVLR